MTPTLKTAVQVMAVIVNPFCRLSSWNQARMPAIKQFLPVPPFQTRPFATVDWLCFFQEYDMQCYERHAHSLFSVNLWFMSIIAGSSYVSSMRKIWSDGSVAEPIVIIFWRDWAAAAVLLSNFVLKIRGGIFQSVCILQNRCISMTSWLLSGSMGSNLGTSIVLSSSNFFWLNLDGRQLIEV